MCLLFYLHDMSCYQDHPWYDRLYTTRIRQLHCIIYFLLQRTGRQRWSRRSPGITRDTRKPRNNRGARNTRNNRDARNTRNARSGSMTHSDYYVLFVRNENQNLFLASKKISSYVQAQFCFGLNKVWPLRMDDVYQLRDHFSFNWRKLFAKVSVLLLNKNVVSELRFRTSATLKFT